MFFQKLDISKMAFTGFKMDLILNISLINKVKLKNNIIN